MDVMQGAKLGQEYLNCHGYATNFSDQCDFERMKTVILSEVHYSVCVN